MRRLFKSAIGLLLVVGMLFFLAACSSNNGGGSSETTGGASTDPASMDLIWEKIFEQIKIYSMENASMGEDAFEDGNLPGYIVTRAKKGDAELDAALKAIGIDPSIVEDYLQVQSMIMVKSDNIIVVRSTDPEKVKEQLNDYHQKQLSNWESYLQDQYLKAKNNVTEIKGDYLYYVTSDVQDKILADIRGVLK